MQEKEQVARALAVVIRDMPRAFATYPELSDERWRQLFHQIAYTIHSSDEWTLERDVERYEERLAAGSSLQNAYP